MSPQNVEFPEVGPAIQAMLTHAGLTQGALARHIGVDIKVINRLCRGRTHLSVDLAARLGRAFGVPAGVFLLLQCRTDSRAADDMHPEIEPMTTKVTETGRRR